ncbi:MAG: hypothetical protein HY053_03945, partial [Proteobacteria bacterium]|nr:hypothetical protein [Pseudomonadota bacterium]
GQRGAQLARALRQGLEARRLVLDKNSGQLLHPRALIETLSQRLDGTAAHLVLALKNGLARRGEMLQRRASALSLKLGFARILEREQGLVGHLSTMLESLSYQRVLQRGFVMVRDAAGAAVMRAAEVKSGQELDLTFADGTKKVQSR